MGDSFCHQDLVPMDTQTQFANSKEHLKSLTASVSKVRDAAERMVQRARQYSADMVHIGKELRWAVLFPSFRIIQALAIVKMEHTQ